ncbi:MAG: hypothetical protein AAGM67_11225, partial [Bacteroidota bacterium]
MSKQEVLVAISSAKSCHSDIFRKLLQQIDRFYLTVPHSELKWQKRMRGGLISCQKDEISIAIG